MNDNLIFNSILDIPPSVNNATSKKKRDYMRYVNGVVKAMGKPRLSKKPIKLVVILRPKTHQNTDLDNIIKVLQDALVHAKLFEDDRQIHALYMLKAQGISNGMISVSVYEMNRVF